MTQPYVLTAAAETDLRNIIRYTRTQWGTDQTRRYIAKLTRCIERLVSGQGAFKELPSLHRDLRTVHCEHHHIFCMPRNEVPALIIALFHERMDLMMRLSDRLK